MLTSAASLPLQVPMASSKLSRWARFYWRHSNLYSAATSLMMPVQALVAAQIASTLLPIIFALYQQPNVSSASCNNTFGSMFESLPTLHNCFMFPNVTYGRFQNAEANQTATDLHYRDGERNATAQNVARVLEDCFLNYCGTLPGCYQETREYRDLPSLWSVDDSIAFNPFFGKGRALATSICDNIPWRINSDVGGIGVSSSSNYLLLALAKAFETKDVGRSFLSIHTHPFSS